MAYESIRSNQGYFFEESPQPYADLTVFLSYNVLTNRYVFDQIQLQPQLHMNEDYTVIHQNIDRSMTNLIQYLAAVNTTLSYNEENLVLHESTFNSTFYDRVMLLSSEVPTRWDPNGTIYISGVELHSKAYYSYLRNFVFNDSDCLPPYTDYTNDF